MTENEARNIIDSAVATHGDEALKGIPPACVKMDLADGFEADDPGLLTEKCVRVSVGLNPLFEAMMDFVIQATRRSDYSWEISLGENARPRSIQRFFEMIQGTQVVDRELAKEAISKHGRRRIHHSALQNIPWHINQPAVQGMVNYIKQSGVCQLGSNANFFTRSLRSTVATVLSIHNNRLFIRVITDPGITSALTFNKFTGGHRGKDASTFGLSLNQLPLCQMPISGDAKEPLATYPDFALSVARVAGKLDTDFVLAIDPNLAETMRNVSRTVSIRSAAGSPGMAIVSVPLEARDFDGLANFTPAIPEVGEKNPNGVDQVASHVALVTVDKANELAKITTESTQFGIVNDAVVADVMRMAESEPVGELRGPGNDRYRLHQDEAISLQIATEIGFVNTCAPGLGKTPMTLIAMREKALQMDRWRGLVTCQVDHLSQWAGEAEIFFPEATVRVLQGSADANEVVGIHQGEHEKVLVITTYDTARNCENEFVKVRWNAFACDEATVLRNTSSARAKALWNIRVKAADVAIALNGTPIEGSIDDIAKMIAWSRKDEALFYGAKMSLRFNPMISGPRGTDGFWEAVGPTVFRRDCSEIQDELPEVMPPQVVKLDPTSAEKTLSSAATEKLLAIFNNLKENVADAAAAMPDDEALREANAEIESLGKVTLVGGINLARLAVADPASVQDSESAGATLLKAAGLVEPAVRGGSTKRNAVVRLTKALVANNEQILIFTDFVRIADRLGADLANRGVRVGVYKGGVSRPRRDAMRNAFNAGDLDVLVLSKAGQKGLNLQAASVIVHYDLPWMPSDIVQRVGRSIRIGSLNSSVQVIVPIMAGTIEERVARVLVPRAAAALSLLDKHRGVDVSKTELGIAISGIEDAADWETNDSGVSPMRQMVEEIFYGDAVPKSENEATAAAEEVYALAA